MGERRSFTRKLLLEILRHGRLQLGYSGPVDEAYPFDLGGVYR